VLNFVLFRIFLQIYLREYNKHMKKEQGFVSIIIASILVIMLTLIVLGFSRIMDREQRQVIDRQLSSQAFYAAETAVNDVYARLQEGQLTDAIKTECDVTDWPVPGANGVINPAEPNVAYTCLMYNQSPSTLVFNNGAVSTQQSKTFQIRNTNGGNIQTITFEWSGANENIDIEDAGCSTQPLPATRLNKVPILRVELAKLPTGAPSIDRNTIINDTTYFYLYPRNSCGATSTNYDLHTATSEKGQLVDVDCNVGVYACTFTIQAMDDPATASDRYIARIRSIYDNADVRVTATSQGGGSFEFFGAQIQVDATGRSNDVLRRINVSLGSPDYPIPDFVLQSMDGVCKNITIAPTTTADPPGIASISCF